MDLYEMFSRVDSKSSFRDFRPDREDIRLGKACEGDWKAEELDDDSDELDLFR